MSLSLDERVIERCLCGTAALSAASRRAIGALVSRDVLMRKTAEFYSEFYCELDKLGEEEVLRVDVFVDALFSKGRGRAKRGASS